MRKIVFLVFLLALVSLPQKAYSYQCWASPGINEIIRDANAVFTGEVVQFDIMEANKEELGTERMNVMFEVNKIWKGLTADNSFVNADVEKLYEYDFQIGKKYLVFAYKIYGDRLSMVGCPRVKLIEDAEKDIKALGKPKHVIKENSSNN